MSDLTTGLSTRMRRIYTADGSATVGNNSTARVSMLPAGSTGSSLLIKANTLPIGACLIVNGSGQISASTVGSPMFYFTPWVTPAGGSKTDLPGFNAAPLIGVVGITWLRMEICQVTGGIHTSGIVSYAQANSANNYPNEINNADTIVASDPTVDRTFGVDGAWSVANAANYVKIGPGDVAIDLVTVSP